MFWREYYSTFFGLQMISPSNVEIYVYLAVARYWPFSIPAFGTIKYYLAIETIVVLMQHCKFYILLVCVWFTVMFRFFPREMPKWMVRNLSKFEYHIANFCYTPKTLRIII